MSRDVKRKGKRDFSGGRVGAPNIYRGGSQKRDGKEKRGGTKSKNPKGSEVEKRENSAARKQADMRQKEG